MCDDKYCMIYLKLLCEVNDLKKDLNVKYNYQKDEWFVKVKDEIEAGEINERIKEQEYIDMEGINMNDDELNKIREIIFLKYFN